MTIAGAAEELIAGIGSDYDRTKAVQEFDDSKIGVKGLVDSGLIKIPRFFIHPLENRPKASDSSNTHHQVPIIDLEGIKGDRRSDIIDEIRTASETWGFFQMVNHGIPIQVLDEMIEGIRSFNEQPNEVKMEFYSRDPKRRVKFSTNFDLFRSRAANWRDSLLCVFNGLDPEELPPLCREIIINYAKHIKRLGDTVFELLSESIGLGPDYLKRIECQESLVMVSHYYPTCPEPELTLGTSKHTDSAFLNILLQDHIGGLQVLHQQCWVNVPPLRGALVVNIGDILQLITNDKLKSVKHRVLASHVGPRVSVASFFVGSSEEKPYGPIKELLCDENPPLYREALVQDIRAYFFAEGLDGKPALDYYKL
ncbi:1-aminocyclopropane-1-carboxylate oxidase homolog 1-like [Tasmannia lanceolata]|uniref:1-aminocyclopropane-1-carboxylate oxidase homolog 1-like n=1 Tax=Tasmannia lanceolata TaxID=3420 RepID=UPI004063ECE0